MSRSLQTQWKLSDIADADDQSLFQRAIDLPKDRRGNKERSKIVSRLWKLGRIVVATAPSST